MNVKTCQILNYRDFFKIVFEKGELKMKSFTGYIVMLVLILLFFCKYSFNSIDSINYNSVTTAEKYDPI